MHNSPRVILHPLLLAAYPVLFLYGQNLGEVALEGLVIPLTFAFAVLSVSYSLFFLHFREMERTSLMTSLFLVIFFFSGIFAELLSKYAPLLYLGETVIPHQFILVFFSAAFLTLSLSLLSGHKGDLKPITFYFNLLASTLALLNLLTVVPFLLSTSLNGSQSSPTGLHPEAECTGACPDIYYIILDAYPRDDVLRESFGFENGPFIDSLSSRGFYVASDSRSNYANSYQSLSSSLNMDYLDALVDSMKSASMNRYMVYEMIKENKVQGYLESKGYVIINFRSGWGPTDDMGDSDIQLSPFDFRENNEFFVVLLQNTVLAPAIEQVIWDSRRENILYAFDNLGGVADMPESTFTFAHILCPHPPFLFDEDGSLPSSDAGLSLDDLMAGQVSFVNRKVSDAVDEILSKSDEPPVIILQADHGTGLLGSNSVCMLKPSSIYSVNESELEDRMKILNAYLLPGGGSEGLYESISPVNSFRVVFNRYFHENLTLLEDRSFISCDSDTFNFREL
ncbi:MAG: hypothetical protein GF416_07895 [Candidatus Altiarchaeales archaeon]|nr:hypothetical protein [Candidatus Altiarchaeales archaeon]MBD3417035.1 hypothetical protein [Candidatus Altiarchaeales archaeon]